MTVRILHGDCRQVLATLPDSSVHCCVTSPPYFGLRDYGVDGQIGLEATPEAFVAELVAVFREVRRVLRDDGTLWLNLGDSYASGGRKSRDPGQSKIHPAYEGESFSEGLRPDDPPGIKPKDLLGIPWRVAFALQADGWYLRQDIIWCLSGGAAVYARTQKGDMPMMVKDLVRLRPETVKLWNGSKWTQVLGWSRSTDTGGALEIELRSGERIGCTRGHQWPTSRGLLRADELARGDVIDSARLPEPEAPKHADALGQDVAWLCGLYLAEGSMSGDKVQLAGHADETDRRLARIERVAAAFHGSASVYTDGNIASITLHGPVIAAAVRAYIHGTSAHDKGIKVRAWQRDDAWLAALLDGYLAGDGHHDEKNGRWRLGFTRNDRLADDLRTLAARLDLPIRLAATTVTGFGKEWPAYRGDIRLTRSTHHNARDGGEVVAIRASRARQFWDIGVEDDPHTFALASGVLTHNSKPNPMPESVRDRCTKAHEYLFLLSKSPTYHCDMAAIAEPLGESSIARLSQEGIDEQAGSHRAPGKTNGPMKAVGRRAPGNISHKGTSAYVAGDDMHRTKSGLVAFSDRERQNVEAGDLVGTRNKRSVWTVTTQPFAEAHFATFPPALIEPCIKAGCPEGGVVLDPFGGAGTTGLVADRLQRDAILIELNPVYADMASRRITGDAPLFAEVAA